MAAKVCEVPYKTSYDAVRGRLRQLATPCELGHQLSFAPSHPDPSQITFDVFKPAHIASKAPRTRTDSPDAGRSMLPAFTAVTEGVAAAAVDIDGVEDTDDVEETVVP